MLGYARVSTSDQSVEIQVSALHDYGCTRIYQETVSGTRSQRPQLLSLLRYARRGDTIVVWKIDRLGRSLKQLSAIISKLSDRDIGLVCITQAIDTRTINGKLLAGLLAVFAEFEVEMIRERTLEGLHAARLEGRTGGRPAKIKGKNKVLMEDLITEGWHPRTLASWFGVSRALIYKTKSKTVRNEQERVLLLNSQ